MRWQVLTPLPRCDSLEQISAEMQAEVDRLAPEQVLDRRDSAVGGCRARPDFPTTKAWSSSTETRCAGSSGRSSPFWPSATPSSGARTS